VKVELPPMAVRVHRGAPIEIGNVYCNNNNPAFKNYRVVIGLAGPGDGKFTYKRPWNYVLLMHIDSSGRVVGVSRESDHIQRNWDLVGKVTRFPPMKVSWLPADTKRRKK